jgi:hypothetical protein
MSESDRYIVPALQRGLQLMQQFTRDEPAHTSAALARKRSRRRRYRSLGPRAHHDSLRLAGKKLLPGPGRSKP